MAIQSSINSLLSQAQSLAAFYRGFKKADQIVGDQATTKNEAQIQTDIAAGNAPMKDGKVDPEWLKQRRDDMYISYSNDYYKYVYDNDGKLSERGKEEAQKLYNLNRNGVRFGDKYVNEFYNDSRVQDYLKPFAANSKLKNKVARNLAKSSVEARTDSINQSKADFNEHTENLFKKYTRGELN